MDNTTKFLAVLIFVVTTAAVFGMGYLIWFQMTHYCASWSAPYWHMVGKINEYSSTCLEWRPNGG